MPARNISGATGRLLQFAFSPRFEDQAGYLLAAGAVAVVFVIRLALQPILGDAAILPSSSSSFRSFSSQQSPEALVRILALALSLAGALYIAGLHEVTWVQGIVFCLFATQCRMQRW
jgi:two-component system sensor kinase FixL